MFEVELHLIDAAQYPHSYKYILKTHLCRLRRGGNQIHQNVVYCVEDGCVSVGNEEDNCACQFLPPEEIDFLTKGEAVFEEY